MEADSSEMTIETLIILSIASLGLTLLSSWVGDDDIVNSYMNRTPTGKEALARIRYVLTKVLCINVGLQV